MGRKPKAEKQKDVMDEISNPPLPIEAHNMKSEVRKSSDAPTMGKKLPKGKSSIVRRSSRLRSLVRSSVKSREIEAVIEEINLIESESEDEPHVEECTQEPMPDDKSLEQKIDHLIQVVEELRTKGLKRQFSNESTSNDISYQSLFFDSQKKVEALNAELHQCNKKLEFAQGKLDAYESVKDVMEKLKDVLLISNLAKATETVVNLSSQVVHGQFSSSRAAAEQDIIGGAPHTSLSPTKKKKRGNNKE